MIDRSGDGLARDGIVTAVQSPGPAGQDALALGAELAGLRDAHMVLAGLWVSPLGVHDRLYADRARSGLLRDLLALRSVVPGDVVVRVEVGGATSLVRGLHGIAESHHARTIVLGPACELSTEPEPRSALDLIHDAPCEVAVAPRGYRDRLAGSRSDVVVAWDATDEAAQALRTGVELAEQTHARLRLVHVVETPISYYRRGQIDPVHVEEWVAAARELGERVLAAGIEMAGDRVTVDGELRDGIAEVELADATWNARFVVCGSRALGRRQRTLLGSTSSGLLARADAPVLVVPRGLIDMTAHGNQEASCSIAYS